jgi:hypothetical protein
LSESKGAAVTVWCYFQQRNKQRRLDPPEIDILKSFPIFNNMKCLVLFLVSTVGFAADYMTGQAARAILGQVSFTSQDTGSPSAFQLGAVSGLAYANGTLFVVDSNHIQADPVYNRVVIFKSLPQYFTDPKATIPQGVRCPLCLGGPNVGSADLVIGQPNFTTIDINLTQAGMRTPSGVATDGRILAVSDTDNNRVLIYKAIPTTIGAQPDIVVGQPNFTTGKAGLDNKTLRGPQGLWIQGNRLFVADTQNHRVMVWNNIPTTNGQAADFVLGQASFSSAPPVTDLVNAATASNLFAPVAVSSDGQRLFVTDLGHSRVLIWNTIPTQTAQAADVVIGQPDMTGNIDNNNVACISIGNDADGKPVLPVRCATSLSFPRFALSDGKRLFIADGGNDRVLVFNKIPTTNGAGADTILGQPDELTDQVTDSTDTFRPDSNVLKSSPNTLRTPLALAFDGVNLYVSDPYDRRVVLYTIGESNIPTNGIVNAASKTVFAVGSVAFGGTTTAKDVITITINDKTYTYTVVDKDTFDIIIQNFVDQINGKGTGTPDPNVVATPNPGFGQLVLTARVGGADGNNILYSASAAGPNATTAATELVGGLGGILTGGGSAAEVAPGTLVTITGFNLSDNTVTAKPDANGFYPQTLGGVAVYFDGILAPIMMVSPTQITTQIPFEVADANGISAYLRIVRNDGSVTFSTAINVPVVFDNPGIFALDGTDPRPIIATHASSNAIAVVSVDGSIVANDTAIIGIEDRKYSYTVQSGDALTTVKDALISLINASPDERVRASAAGQYNRIILTAKVAGPDGNGIPITGSNNGDASSIIITAFNGATCCASVAGAPVTLNNPATPGEVITFYATGVGPVLGPDGSLVGVTGQIYSGPAYNTPSAPIDNAQIGGLTGNVLNSGLKPGMLGVYEVQVQLSPKLPTNPNTQVFIAQNVFTSNIVTIPVVAAPLTTP